MDKRYEVALPEDLLAEVGWPEAEVADRIKEALVMDLLRLDRISEAQAAEILGLNRWDILEVMGRHDVPAIQMTPEELKEELARGIPRSA